MNRIMLTCACLTVMISACCKRDTHKNDRWIKGGIYSSTDSLPISNTSFKIYQHVSTEGYELQNTREFKTDAGGGFYELFNAGEGDYAYICLPEGDDKNFVKGFRITGSGVDVGKIYVQR